MVPSDVVETSIAAAKAAAIWSWIPKDNAGCERKPRRDTVIRYPSALWSQPLNATFHNHICFTLEFFRRRANEIISTLTMFHFDPTGSGHAHPGHFGRDTTVQLCPREHVAVSEVVFLS